MRKRASISGRLPNRLSNPGLHIGRDISGACGKLVGTPLSFPIDILDQQFHLGNLANLGIDDARFSEAHQLDGP